MCSDLTQEGEQVVWQLEGCCFDPRLLLAKHQAFPDEDTKPE